MKLRLYANHVRLRLSRVEVARIANGESIEERTALAPIPLIVRLVVGEDSFVVGFDGGTLSIVAPRDPLRRWADGDDVGVAHVDAAGVRLLIEKDFQCLHGEEADQADCFPNPLADASA